MQGAKLLAFRLSGTPKNTAGKPIFLHGFPTGKPEKSRSWKANRFPVSIRKS